MQPYGIYRKFIERGSIKSHQLVKWSIFVSLNFIVLHKALNFFCLGKKVLIVVMFHNKKHNVSTY